MTSCKGTWISHFHYMSPELRSPSKILSVYEFSCFNIYFLACNKSLYLFSYFWSQGRFMTSCKGTGISHFHYMFEYLPVFVHNWVLRLKRCQCTNFHVSTFISWRVISLRTFSPIFGPKGDLWRHAMGHEFHIFTIWVHNWVLRLKLCQCTNFHVLMFISSRVISVRIFTPILVPGEIYDVMQGDMNLTFSLYESRIEFSV